MRGVERVINQFIANDAPYFIIVDGKNNCTGKNDKYEDIESSARRLENFLNVLDEESRAKFNIYCFEQLPEGKLKGKVKDIVSQGDHDYLIQFMPYERLPQEDAEAKAEARALYKYNREQQEKQMADRLERIEAAMLKREIEDNAADDEEIEESAEPKGLLSGIIDHPQIQGAIAGALATYLGNFLTPNKPMAMAGIPDLEEAHEVSNTIDKAIKILSEHDDQIGNDLMILAEMAEKDPNKFQFLISMLRK